MSNYWKDIWNNKGNIVIDDNIDEYQCYKLLKRANGYDVEVNDEHEYYSSFYNEWINVYNNIQKITQNGIKSVFEVGCGSGVNLYMYKNRGIQVAGIDYSHGLIEIAKQFGNKDINYGEAVSINVLPRYDLVQSEGVFEYFESLEYAEKVLRKMIEKSNKIVFLGGVWDKDKEDELMDYRRATIKDYDERYKNLQKQFYSKDWVINISNHYNRKVEFEEVNNSAYWNSKYTYNCYIY